jgi:hypothetical protein
VVSLCRGQDLGKASRREKGRHAGSPDNLLGEWVPQGLGDLGAQCEEEWEINDPPSGGGGVGHGPVMGGALEDDLEGRVGE